jgi:hypothetical protein
MPNLISFAVSKSYLCRQTSACWVCSEVVDPVEIAVYMAQSLSTLDAQSVKNRVKEPEALEIECEIQECTCTYSRVDTFTATPSKYQSTVCNNHHSL